MEAAFQRLGVVQKGHVIWYLAHNRSQTSCFFNKNKHFLKTNGSMITACVHIALLAFPPTGLNTLNKHCHPRGHPCYGCSWKVLFIPYPNEEKISEG